MEELKKGRKPLQDQLKRLVEQCQVILQKVSLDSKDFRDLRINQERLLKINAKLETWDEKVINQLALDEAPEEEVQAEYQCIEELSKQYIGIRGDIDEVIARRAVLNSTDGTSVVGSAPERKKKYHLPELKLKTFGGNLLDWLGWWSQFKQIHEDDDLRTSDKFMYLIQSMEPRSEARRIVESFPLMDANYVSAVDALRQRYGRNDLLLQLYLRQLQSVVIAHASGHKKLPLSDFYVEIVSHLRSLSALNLDKADPATWLFPLVGSGLSEETLKAWQRSPLAKPDAVAEDVAEGVPKKTRLDCLMESILAEVERNQQIKLAKQAFTEKKPQEPKRFQKWRGTPAREVDVPSIAGLFAGQEDSLCGFCDKAHDPEKCWKAKKMTLDERYKVLRDKKLCFSCARGGHPRFKCRSKVKCGSCQGRHIELMCNKKDISPLKRSGGESSGLQVAKRTKLVTRNDDEDLEIVSQQVNQCSGKVLLNTLKVYLRDERGRLKMVRLVGDSASQRSFGAEPVLEEIASTEIGDEYLQAILFGGKLSIPQRYKKKLVTIVGLNGVQQDFKLLEKRKVTGKIREIPEDPWLDQLREYDIELNDVGDNWSEADILIGNDYWGAIRTGNLIHLPGGLTAEETIFGWTLGGPTDGESEMADAGLLIYPACFKSSPPQDIEKLWSLEALGIKDPSVTLTLKEEEEAAMKQFYSTVRRDQDGRFIVALPWKLESNQLPTNRAVAVQRLKSTTRNLIKNGIFEAYDAVFKTWEAEGLIEKVTSEDSIGHLIPHRPVFKESTTTPVRPVFDASCRLGRNHSLNDCLYKGPNLIEYIPSMLLRFGWRRIGVTADIRKAFQMLGVLERHRKYQCFLWWKDSHCKQIIVFRHNRVVFGMTCSPFLLGAVIKYHLEKSEDPMARKLNDSFYVNNLVMSVDNIEEYLCLKEDATRIMNAAKMELRQW